MFTDYGCWIRGTTYFKLLTSVAEPGYFGRSRDILAGAGILSYFGRGRFEGDSGSSLDEKDNILKDIIFLGCNKTLIQIKINYKLDLYFYYFFLIFFLYIITNQITIF